MEVLDLTIDQNQDRTSTSKTDIEGRPLTEYQNEDALKNVSILEQVPADLDLAERHAKAKRVGKAKSNCKEVCECCGVQIESEPLNICCTLVELSFLGPGIPLYFGFLKALIILFLISALIYSTFGIIFNGNGNFCIEPYSGQVVTSKLCITNVFNKYSLINRSNDYDALLQYNIVNLIVVFSMVIGMHLYRRQMRVQQYILDDSLTSPSDYTAQLSNLPGSYKEQDIRALLNEWWQYQISENKNDIQEFVIEKVCIAYDISEYLAKIKQRNTANLQIRKNNAYLSNNKGVYPSGKSRDFFNVH